MYQTDTCLWPSSSKHVDVLEPPAIFFPPPEAAGYGCGALPLPANALLRFQATALAAHGGKRSGGKHKGKEDRGRKTGQGKKGDGEGGGRRGIQKEAMCPPTHPVCQHQRAPFQSPLASDGILVHSRSQTHRRRALACSTGQRSAAQHASARNADQGAGTAGQQQYGLAKLAWPRYQWCNAPFMSIPQLPTPSESFETLHIPLPKPKPCRTCGVDCPVSHLLHVLEELGLGGACRGHKEAISLS